MGRHVNKHENKEITFYEAKTIKGWFPLRKIISSCVIQTARSKKFKVLQLLLLLLYYYYY